VCDECVCVCVCVCVCDECECMCMCLAHLGFSHPSPSSHLSRAPFTYICHPHHSLYFSRHSLGFCPSCRTRSFKRQGHSLRFLNSTPLLSLSSTLPPPPPSPARPPAFRASSWSHSCFVYAAYFYSGLIGRSIATPQSLVSLFKFETSSRFLERNLYASHHILICVSCHTFPMIITVTLCECMGL
jgi:hypothetical protein